jgi:hypothetical protein
MNLLLLLAVAVPLSCLAFLSWLAFVGVMTLGAVINVIGIVRAGGPQRTPQWVRVSAIEQAAQTSTAPSFTRQASPPR